MLERAGALVSVSGIMGSPTFLKGGRHAHASVQELKGYAQDDEGSDHSPPSTTNSTIASTTFPLSQSVRAEH